MILKPSLLLILSLLASTICVAAAALPARKPPMPARLPDPKPPKGDGSGAYKSKGSPSLGDRVAYLIARGMVKAGKKFKKPHAAFFLDRYLDKGKDYNTFDPGVLINESPRVRKRITKEAIAVAQQLFRDMKEEKGYVEFTYEWGTTHPENLSDWWFAVGGFSYSIAGVITKTGVNKGKLDYVVDFYDIYNWNKGTKFEIHGKEISTDRLGRLNAVGLAKDYKIRGRSKVFTILDLMECPRSSTLQARSLEGRSCNNGVIPA